MAVGGKLSRISGYALSHGIQTATPILLTPIFTRLIAPEEYGVQGLFTVVLIIGVGAANWGLTYAFERYFFAYGEEARRRQLLGTVISACGLGLLVANLVVWVFRQPLAAHLVEDSHWHPMLPLMLFTASLAYLNGILFAELKNRQEIRSYVSLDLFRFGVTTGISFCAVVILRWNIWGAVVGVAAGQALCFLIFVWRHRGQGLFAIDRAILKECLLFSWPMCFKTAAGTLNLSVDKYMIGVSWSVGALGIYGKAQMLGLVVLNLMLAVQNVYAPIWGNKIYGRPDNEPLSLPATFSEFCVISTLPAVFFMLSVQEVVWILMPPSYYGVIPLAIALAYLWTFAPLGIFQACFTSYLKLLKQETALTIAGQLMNIGLNFALIPMWGAMGAVLATSASTFVPLVGHGVIVRRRMTIGFELGFLLRLHGVIAAAAVVGLLCFYKVLPYAAGLGLRGVVVLLAVLVACRRLPVRLPWRSGPDEPPESA